MIHNYTCKYKNVLLKPLAEEDTVWLRVWRNDESNSKYLRRIPHITEEMQTVWYNNYLCNKDELCFSITETEILHRIVGSLSLYNFEDNSAEFGKILIGDPEAHGKSVGYNAIMAVLMIAFKELELSKVFLHVYAENKKALHLYKKVGFSLQYSKISEGMEEYYMDLKRKDFEKII